MWISTVVLPLAVFTCVALGSLSRGKGEKPTEDLAKDLERMRRLHMGYFQTKSLGEQPAAADTMPEEDLRKEIQNAYNRLQCSYALFALRHLRLTASRLLNADELWKNVHSYHAQYHFKAEASAMLAAALDDPKLTAVKYLLWPLWLYAERVEWYVEAVFERKISVAQSFGSYVNIQKAHLCIDRLLEDFLNSDQCAPYDARTKLDSLSEQLLEDANTQMLYAHNNKRMFSLQKIMNKSHGVSTGKERHVSLSVLCLNGLPGLRQLVVRLVGKSCWRAIHAGLAAKQRAAASLDEPLSAQAVSIAALQNEYVVVLKLIALLLSKSYLAASIEHADADQLNSDNRKAARALKEFCEAVGRPADTNIWAVNLLILDNETDGKDAPTDEVTDMVIDEVTDMVTDTVTHEVTDKRAPVLKVVDKEIANVAKNSKIAVIAVNAVRQSGVGMSAADESHALLAERIERFVDNVKQMLFGVDFKVVNSFGVYTSSDPHRKLIKLEEMLN